MFRDRLEAGVMLASKLKKYKNDPSIILAVPRGGVPVAYAVASALGLPVELVLTKKIGHPQNKEYAIGAASLTNYFVMPDQQVSRAYIAQELLVIRKRLKEMQHKFFGNNAPQQLEGKTVIVIDDGIATGNTILATIGVLRKSRPKKIVVAVPVAPKSTIEKLSAQADEVVALIIPEEFYGVGAYYNDFEQVADHEVMIYLAKLKELKRKKAKTENRADHL